MLPQLKYKDKTIVFMADLLDVYKRQEFSFFLAVPTMLAATGYKLLKHVKEYGGFTTDETKLLLIGNVVAFIVALLAIRFFINFLKTYGFRVWGIYRIIIGAILIILLQTGYLKA